MGRSSSPRHSGVGSDDWALPPYSLNRAAVGKWLGESFNGKMRDELLAREIFYSLKEAQILIEAWRVYSNQVRPHSALGYQPPALVMILDPMSAQSLTVTLVQ